MRLNKSISSKTQAPVVGCASHRVNLAVQQIMLSETNLTTKIQKIILNIRTVVATKLRKLTPSPPKLQNETRGSSTYEICAGYLQHSEYLPSLDCRDAHNLLLTVVENKRVE